MNELIIRSATKNDMPSVLELIKELALFEKSPDKVVLSVKDLEKDGFGNDPLFKCFVAEINNKIIGMAFFYFRYSTWRGRTLHLEDLIVKNKWQSKGIGKALYNKFIEYAYKEKVRRIEWVVLDWNKSAINFYNQSGAKILNDWKTVQMEFETMKKYLNK
tara:strand:- start:552 stop:1031 length:480 start_codon:yes stop_codon:yes gene_type:complete